MVLSRSSRVVNAVFFLLCVPLMPLTAPAPSPPLYLTLNSTLSSLGVRSVDFWAFGLRLGQPLIVRLLSTEEKVRGENLGSAHPIINTMYQTSLAPNNG